MKSFSLQFKLNLIITLLLLGLLLTWAVSVIKNAREDVLAEVDSTTNLVMHLLDAEIAHAGRTTVRWPTACFSGCPKSWGLLRLHRTRLRSRAVLVFA